MSADADSVTIRHAFPDDALALVRLAALDSAEVTSQPMLVAEVDGELRVALSLRDGAVIADPFHRTAAFVQLLRARAEQLAAEAAASVPRKPRYAQIDAQIRTRSRFSSHGRPASGDRIAG